MNTIWRRKRKRKMINQRVKMKIKKMKNRKEIEKLGSKKIQIYRRLITNQVAVKNKKMK